MSELKHQAALLFLCISSVAQCASAQHSRIGPIRQRSSNQPTNIQRLLETASGAAVGQDLGYHLSFTPAQRYPMRAFRNGLEMISGTDYTIQGQTFTLRGNVPLIPGDVFQFAYYVEATEETPAGAEPHNDHAGRDVLSKFLDRTLSEQMSSSAVGGLSASAPQSAAKFNSLGVTPDIPANSLAGVESGLVLPVHAYDESSYRSLLMLSKSLSKSPKEQYGRGKTAIRHIKDGTAIGVDGLGDDLAYNQFSNWLNAQVGRDGSVLSTKRKGQGGAENIDNESDNTPRSLQMLQKRLRDAQ